MKAFGYLRVSTKDQRDRGHSLETQAEEVSRYCQQHGLTLVEIFQEDASGFVLNRPELSRLRAGLSEGQAGAVVVFDSDRLSREPIHYMMLRDEWQQMGIRLHYVRQGEIALDDTMAQAIQDFKARIHRYEVEQLVERSRRNKRGKVKKGKIITAQRPPFGYRQIGDTLEIDPEEAQIVRLIFELYIQQGLSIRATADELSARKIPTRADKSNIYKKRGFGQWAKNTVRNIIKNETYTGVWHWGKTRREWVMIDGRRKLRRWDAPREEWIAVEVPTIVDRALWEAAQARLGENARLAKRNQRHDYLMARRLECKCGQPIYADSSRPEPGGKKYLYYRCSSRHKDKLIPSCGADYVRAGELDETVWDWVKELLEQPDMMQQLIEKQIEQIEPHETEQKLKSTQRKINHKKEALARLYQRWAEAEDQTEATAIEEARQLLRDEITELESSQTALRRDLVASASKDELLTLAESVRLHQDALLLENEPFGVRLGWVEALNLTGVVDTVHNEIEISCDLGQWVLSIGTRPSTKCGRIWQIKDILLLTK